MPRRGDERVFHGRFWGGRTERGPVTRFELDGARGAFTHRLLVQGGVDGGVWTTDGTGPGSPNEGAALMPLVPGVEMTPFDVLPMPYLYWLDTELASVDRIRGRPAYAYVFTPSADFAARNPSVKSVKAYLDTQYDALVQSEITGPNGHVAKTLSLLELRKVGERWIPKDVDVRNEATRDKTRLSLTAVAIGAPVDPSAFDPENLGSPLAPPDRARVIRVSP
jgi:Outer membrane lipoprotein-sorting protein